MLTISRSCALMLMRNLTPLLLLCLLGSLLPGCGGGSSPSTAPTYWSDVAPIYYDKCVRCHQAGGIAPFALDDYGTARLHAADSAVMVEQGLMPPFLVDHQGGCGDFEDDETLSEAQRSTILAWARGGAAEGTKATLRLPDLPHLTGATELRTPDFAPTPQGGALAAHDEYRCFLLDSGLDHDAFITGYEVIPGNAAIVHHVLIFTVDPARPSAAGTTNGAAMAALDAASPDRAGWPCFGGAGEGIDVSAVPVTWAPGQGVVSYPGGVGAGVARAEKMVVQLHYNLVDAATIGQRDQTVVRLRFADTVARRALFLLPDPFLDSLGEATPAMLAPGRPSVTYDWSLTAEQLGLGDLPYADIIGVMPHMHERGRRLQLSLAGAAAGGAPPPAPACIAKVGAWDFHWQKMYFYDEAPRLTAGSAVSVTCDYDTRSAREPVLPGWGTQNEMCLAVMMVALPPGM